MKPLLSAFFFIIGSVFGSFSNVLIYRIPRGISIIKPSSFCPECGAKIKVYDNIPIISYIILRGKCRECGRKISIRYPLVEILMGILFFIFYLKYEFSLTFLKAITLSFFAINISAIDIEKMVIPDILSIPGIVLAFILALLSRNFLYFLAGGLTGFLIPSIFYIIGKIIKKELMGEGDIIILSMIGLYVGWLNVLIAIFIASLTGSLFGIPLKIKKKINYLPFAPFLFFSSLLFFLYDFSSLLPYIFFKSYLK